METWQQRTRLTAAIGLIGALAASVACGKSNKPEPPPPPLADAAVADPGYAEWAEAITAEETQTYDRIPLFPPAIPGRAADDYIPAVKVDVPMGVYSRSQEIISGELPWKKVPAEIAQFVTGPQARDAAELVLRGASRADGRSIAPMRSDILSIIEGNPHLIVMLIAIADAATGEVDRACRYLLALQRLTQDLARGAPLVATMIGRTYQQESLPLLRRLARGLTEEQLRRLVEAYGRLISTQVAITHSFTIETLFMAQRTIDQPIPPGESDTVRREALARLAVQREVAVRLAEQRSLAERVEFFERENCRDAETEGACLALSKYIVAIALQRAQFLATYIALALELDRRSRGRLATSLAELVPGTIPAVPDDPITGQPFEYVKVGGGMAIRRGATDLDGKEQVEPREILLSR